MPPADGLARALVDLQALAERLRRECPWDREQTAESIVPHTVEEAYEVADGALAGDDPEPGDVLFAAVNVARKLAADPELALRGATRRFVARVEEAEQLAAGDGREFGALTLDEQDAYFDRAKERE